MEYQQQEGVTVKKTWLLWARKDLILVGYLDYGYAPSSPEVVLGREGRDICGEEIFKKSCHAVRTAI